MTQDFKRFPARYLLVLATFAVLSLSINTCVPQLANAQALNGVVSQLASEQFGLRRQWLTQIDVDPARSQVTQIHLSFDKLFALTDSGLLQAIDAKSGKTDWKVQLGKRGYPSFGPGANGAYVAIVNGATLYVVQRGDGKLVWERELGGGPGAGPAVSATRVFVPLFNGVIEGYELADPVHSPWRYPTDGQTFIQPIAAAGRVAWPTLSGYMYIAKADPPGVLYRVEAEDRITSAAAYKAPNFYMGSRNGTLYAFEEKKGDILWRFVASESIIRSPVVIGDRVYVAPEREGMFSVSTESGRAIWHASGVDRFLAASPKRIYTMDRFNRLHILDAESGTQLGVLTTRGLNLFVSNWQTDRIYVGRTDGLLQCVREADLEDAVVYAAPPPVEGKDKSAKPTDSRKPESAEASPADARTKPAKEPATKQPSGKNPFQPGGTNPFDNPN